MGKWVPIDIVTGFLGSGKTTLIQYVLQNGLKGQRVAVVVDDLSEYNVDGQIIKGIHIDRMVQMVNGCICCSGIYQIGLGLQELIETADPTLILIETSGAALVGPVVAQFNSLGYRTDAIITVVDVEQFTRLMKREPVVTEQVRMADFLVLNKSDLGDRLQIAKVKHNLHRQNPKAPILPTRFGQVGAELLFATGISRLRTLGEEASPFLNGMEHFTYKTQTPLDLKRVTRLFARMPNDFYRAKGFLRFLGEPYPFLLNFTCGRFVLDPFPSLGVLSDKPFTSQLVFVGRKIKTHQKEVTEALNRSVGEVL